MHEAQMHEHNSFITLTINPETLEQRPRPWSLDITEIQKFMKRLRMDSKKAVQFMKEVLGIAKKLGQKNRKRY